jgi:lipoic acid synthetase
MLGMGETAEEVGAVLNDLRNAGCEFLSLGQYLAPSVRHAPVREYISPEQFARYRQFALGLGFRFVESGPYVRSSYLASHYLAQP